MKHLIPSALLFLSLYSCSGTADEPSASGTLEATETIISAEATGVIRSFTISEGENLKKDQYVGYIDSTQLYLRKKQIEAQIKAVLSRSPDISAQLAAVQEQLVQAEREQKRISSLLEEDAATQKQMDDVNAQVKILKKQHGALRSNLGITASGLTEETSALNVQIEQVNDQLRKCRIVNPVNGTVLGKYAEPNEMTMPGKPLYKIADVSTLTVRAYITGDQLSQVKNAQQVKVTTGSGEHQKQYTGTVEWISSKAEFTPKTIQTKEERANLVYAIKVRVKNDGFLKIGMYADIEF